MRAYQEEYLRLLKSVSENVGPDAGKMGPEEFVTASRELVLRTKMAVERGTRLLREELFPLLDDILSATEEELSDLVEFAGKLMNIQAQSDVWLHYRIHLALMDYARHRNLRDMLIRELYLVGMSLYNMESMLSPSGIRLYSARMRMYFSEAASYFETEYDDITDPETRGYIHRSMGNIALSYEGTRPEVAKRKLEAVTRSIRILSDPDIRAKTPELPWDTYLYKSHQERTSLLSYLRSGHAGPDAFAKVLESAQIVQERQMKDARERGELLQPRWQYAYLAAMYHSGAMTIEELLDGIYALSRTRTGNDFSFQGAFAFVSAPALYMEYLKFIPGGKMPSGGELRIRRMTDRMLSWLIRAPSDENNETLLFFVKQLLYAYREVEGGVSFFELLQDVFAARHPVGYVRMWIAAKLAGRLAGWAIDDCPGELVGVRGVSSADEVRARREELSDFAMKAGRLYDSGMVHFFHLENSACRGLFEEEAELIRLHAYCGCELLGAHESTAAYADVAKGHHRYYNDKGGYPVDFDLSSTKVRPVIGIVAAADVLASSVEETASRYRPVREFDAAVEELIAGAGRKYAPFIAALLKKPGRREELRTAVERLRSEAYLDMYRRRAAMAGREENT